MIDLYLANRIASRFTTLTEEEKYVLSTLFAAFRLGHLAIDTSETALARLAVDLAIPDPPSFLEKFKKGMLGSFIDREGICWVVKQGPFILFQKNFQLQTELLKEIDRLAKAPSSLSVASPYIHPDLNEEQKQGVLLALQSPFSLLTGGPGTGKSFTAAALIEAYREIPNLSVIVTAPTGKAAFHLGARLSSKKIDLRVGTLHSFLAKGTSFLCADLILVDECSMIDAQLLHLLLKSIVSGSRVVLIGDKEQLPPVETGSFFADLIESNAFPCTPLSTSVRTESSVLLQIANLIRLGSEEEAYFLLKKEGLWIDLETTSLLEQIIEEYTPCLVSDYDDPAPSNEVILSCMKEGPLGVEALNRKLHAKGISFMQEGKYLAVPFLVTANCHELRLYNGEQGTLFMNQKSPSEHRALFISAQGEKSLICPLALPSSSLGYALSIHKSQGSEYDEVLIIAPPGSEVFGREVLYTAITRAKKRMRLATTRDQFSQIVRRSSRKLSALPSLISDTKRRK